MKRLAEAVVESRRLPALAIVAEVNRAVAEFTGAAAQSDDITLIVARRVPSVLANASCVKKRVFVPSRLSITNNHRPSLWGNG